MIYIKNLLGVIFFSIFFSAAIFAQTLLILEIISTVNWPMCIFEASWIKPRSGAGHRGAAGTEAAPLGCLSPAFHHYSTIVHKYGLSVSRQISRQLAPSVWRETPI